MQLYTGIKLHFLYKIIYFALRSEIIINLKTYCLSEKHYFKSKSYSNETNDKCCRR